MKTQYTNLVELAQAVEANRQAKKDLIADTRQVEFTGNGELVTNGEAFPINDHAHRQIGDRVQIPAKYYDRMRREAPELLADNVNTWFRKNPERRMIRTLSGNVRAFLSDRYQRIDNEKVLATILPIFQEIPDLKIKSLALTETRMYLKATVPSIRGEVKVGDLVEAGIECRNGEIGNSMFEVWPFAERLECLNGMRFPVGGFKKTHLGARADVHDEVYEMLTDETLRVDDQAFLLKARDVVKATLSENTFQKLLGKMRAAAEDKIEENPVEAVKVLSQSLALTETEGDLILRHLIEGGDLSRWGVANAITRTAQDVESYDRSDELEAFGGKIVDLPRSEWKELAQAA
jgi:hypothetical protein